ncbi:methyltransferase domain-containing protein [Pseudomonas sp. KCJK8993]|uniref:methyltransferase domain-containing protein n=1 Tax=Pseudomonas sp. KCJK8993 TaxID=3344565 RepID=UPI0039066EAE
MSWLADLLRDPSVNNIDVDDSERLLVHGRMLEQKPMLKEVFTSFHHTFERLDKQFLSGAGERVELGAGVSPIRNSYPDVLATDIVPGPGLDRVLDAERLDLADSSVRVIFGQNCFHHFPHPSVFFEELERVLVPGGGVILLEPYHGPFAAFLFRRMFRTEGYDKDFPSWETPASGPMNGANQALSYIVFERDRAEFERRFPQLDIVHQETCDNYLKYLFSGGLNFRQLWPNWASPLLSLIQRLLSPLNRWLALHHVVVIRKKG